MNVFDYRLPSLAFRKYIRQYQIIGFSFGPEVVIPVKPYWPRPENCLTFFPRGGDTVQHLTGVGEKITTRSVVIGQHSYLLNRQVGNDFILFQVVLQPGALFRLAGIPSNELTNVFLDAEAVFSSEIGLVKERLSSTDNHLEMIQIVEAFLYYLVRRQITNQSRFSRLPIDKVGHFLLQNPTCFSLEWLADQACLSPRQFERKFVERIGIGPKLFSRISRFHKAFIWKEAHPQADWLTVAVHFGYTDFHHLFKDFREFAGVTPNTLLSEYAFSPEKILHLA